MPSSFLNISRTDRFFDVISATLDLAYTAMGAFDIWWEGGCWEWYGYT